MNNISILSDQIWFSLSQALIHSIWQGFVLMIVVAFMLYVVKLNKPQMRYWIAVGGVVSFLLIFAATFLNSFSSFEQSRVFDLDGQYDYQIIQNLGITVNSAGGFSFSDLINPTLITTLWLCGFVLFGIRMLFSYGYLQYIHLNARKDEDSEIYHMMQELKAHMKIDEHIELRISNVVDTIFTYGFFRPIIVWPISLLNNLNADEVSLILAHELAHIRRKDYLVKLLLNLVNVILYYHPLVWWLNRVINNEREHACDLAALAQNGDSTRLAMALVKLQEHKLNIGVLASNHFNDKNSFSNRIKRLFNMPIKQSFSKSKLTILLLFIAFGLFAMEFKNIKSAVIDDGGEAITTLMPTITNIPSVTTVTPVDTIKPITENKSSAVIIKNDGKKSVKMEMENGEIKNLEVDGKVIDKEDYDQYTNELNSVKELTSKNGRGFVYGIGDHDAEPFIFNMEEFKGMNDSIFSKFNFGMGGLNDSLFTRNFKFDMPNGMQMYFMDEDGNHSFGNMDMKRLLERQKLSMDEQRELLKKHGITIEREREHSQNMREHSNKMRENSLRMQDHLQKLQSEMEGMNQDRVWSSPPNNWQGNAFGLSSEPGSANLEQKLGSQLNKDGFLLPEKENSVKLTGKYLKINGEKMPEVIFEKYKRLFEEETGIPLSDKNVIEFKMEGKPTSGRKYRAF